MSSNRCWRWNRVFSDASRGWLRLWILLLITALSGCQKKVSGPPPRYIVIRFENLSGDSSLEWIGRAASEILSRSLAGAMDGPVLDSGALARLAGTFGPRPPNAPGISTDREEAVAAGATRIITGYIDRTNGPVRLSATELDVATGKSVRTLAAADAAPLTAISQLAHEFSVSARPPLTLNADALRLYTEGFEGSGDAAVADLENSIQADPGFGPAWVLLVNAHIAHGKLKDAEELIDRSHNEKLQPLDAANLDLAAAIVHSSKTQRLTALRQISALSPGDTILLRSVAQADTAAGEFEQAAADWNKLASVLPNDANAWNQLGYTRGWNGDFGGAVAAMKEYARLRPADPNPLDSLGDIQYSFRKYADAAVSYVAADTKDPAFQGGGDLYKAAMAKFKAGDKAGADALFAQFRKAREKAKSVDFGLTEADWLYRTGRKNKAISLMRADSSAAAKAQLVVWDLVGSDRDAAIKDAAALGQPATPAAFLARFVALRSASAAEWERRASEMLASPAAAGLRRVAVGYALILDDKQDDALPVWKEIVSNAPGTDFLSRDIYAELKGDEPRLDIPPDPNSVNSFAAILDLLKP